MYLISFVYCNFSSANLALLENAQAAGVLSQIEKANKKKQGIQVTSLSLDYWVQSILVILIVT